MVKARGGNIYVGGWIDDTGENGFFRATQSPATSFASRTTVADGNIPDRIVFGAGGETDSNDILVAYGDKDASELTVKTYDDSANSWSESAAIDVFTTADDHYMIDAVDRFSDNHFIVAIWNARSDSNGDLAIHDITDGTTFSEKTDVVTNQNVIGSGPAILINQKNDDLYVAYVNATPSTSVKYRKSTDDAGSWGAITDISVVSGNLDVVMGGTSVGDDGGRWMPVWFDDDLDDLTTNKDNSVEIAGLVNINITDPLEGSAKSVVENDDIIITFNVTSLLGAEKTSGVTVDNVTIGGSGNVCAINNLADCVGTANLCSSYATAATCNKNGTSCSFGEIDFNFRTNDNGTSASDGLEVMGFAALPDANYVALANALSDDDTVYSLAIVTKVAGSTTWKLEDDSGSNEAANFMWAAISQGHTTIGDKHVECGSETGAAASSFAIKFATAFPDTNYAVVCNPLTDLDSPICILSDAIGKATTGFTVALNDDAGSAEGVLGVDWCAFAYGDYSVGNMVIKAGSKAMTNGALTVDFGVEGLTDYADTEYIVLTLDATSLPQDGCACEVTDRTTGDFDALCTDDGADNLVCDETIDWVTLTITDLTPDGCFGTVTECSFLNYDNSTACTATGCTFAETAKQRYTTEGWEVNVSIANACFDSLTGTQDLFINITFGENTFNDTEVKAIDYSGEITTTLNLPVNYNNSINFSNVLFNCSATAGANNLANISLFSDYNGSWKFITKNSLNGTSNSTTFTRNIYTDKGIDGSKFIDTSFIWNCRVNDTGGGSDFADSNFTFSSWSLNSTYENTTTNNVSVTLSVNDTNQYPNTTGFYYSKIFDAGPSSSYNEIGWVENLPTNVIGMVWSGNDGSDDVGIFFKNGSYCADQDQDAFASDIAFNNCYTFSVAAGYPTLENAIGLAWSGFVGSGSLGIFFKNGSHCVDTSQTALTGNIAFNSCHEFTIPTGFSTEDAFGLVFSGDDFADDAGIFFKNGSYCADLSLTFLSQDIAFDDCSDIFTIPDGFSTEYAIGVAWSGDDSSDDVGIFFKNGSYWEVIVPIKIEFLFSLMLTLLIIVMNLQFLLDLQQKQLKFQFKQELLMMKLPGVIILQIIQILLV